jgi:hypothetical protein
VRYSAASFTVGSLVILLGAASVTGCSVFFPGSNEPSGGGSGQVTPTGCGTGPTQPVAPGGYYVNGNSVCTADGHTHLFHGVDRPSLEWSPSGVMLSAADFQLMATWKANAVRIALNQDFWLSGSPYYNAGYAARIDNAVAWAEQAGMDPILDLHWSDAGTLGGCDPTGGNCQQFMPDDNSLTFWTEVATRYKDDGRVLFELYNEPHDVSWGVWKSGGDVGGWHAVGMQQLYDAIRATGANNLIVMGGIDFAYDLTGVTGVHISGYNILYATHPYASASEKKPNGWDHYWGFLTKTAPVIVTEFGDSNTTCPSDYTSQLIAYADLHNASWTAWAWYPGGCTFPSIISDWSGTPSAPGAVVKTALLGYHDPAPDGKRDAGAAAPDAAPDAGNDGGTAADAGDDGG